MSDLADLKRRVLDGIPVTNEEYRAVIDAIREGRSASAGRGRQANKPLPENLDDLFKPDN